MSLSTTRWIDLIFFFICALFLGAASYLQFVVGLVPCPLCILQRFIITVLGLLFLMGALFDFLAITRCCLHVCTFLLSGLGLILAGRQLWLEYFPANTLLSCQALLTQPSRTGHFRKIIALFFNGSSNCGADHWHFLHLSMPMWTLLFFMCALGMAWRQIYINHRKHKQQSFF